MQFKRLLSIFCIAFVCLSESTGVAQDPAKLSKELYHFNQDTIPTIVWYIWLCNKLGIIYKGHKSGPEQQWINHFEQVSKISEIQKEFPVTIDSNPFDGYNYIHFTKRYKQLPQLSSIILSNKVKKHLIIATMGTQTVADGVTDMNGGNWFTTNAHWGFQKVTDEEIASLNGLKINWNEYDYISFVGHSLGGAVAFMLATETVKTNPYLMQQMNDHNQIEVVQFGPPQVYSQKELNTNKQAGVYKHMTIIMAYQTYDPVTNFATGHFGAYGIKGLGLKYDTYDQENGGTQYIKIQTSDYDCKGKWKDMTAEDQEKHKQFCHRSGSYFEAMKAILVKPDTNDAITDDIDIPGSRSLLSAIQPIASKANWIGYCITYFVIIFVLLMR